MICLVIVCVKYDEEACLIVTYEEFLSGLIVAETFGDPSFNL